MKTRDEFIKSVREKSQIAIAEKEAARAEKKIKKKRIIRWSVAAAACLVVAVSADGFISDTASTAEPGDAAATDSYGGAGKYLYMLPAGIVLEDLANDNRTEITGEDIAEYMDWFYNLPDEMKLTTEEYEEECKESEPERTVRYRFTMDLSLGEDKDGVDRIFYIFDGAELPAAN